MKRNYTQVEKLCIGCGKPYLSPNWKKRRYCHHDCFMKHKTVLAAEAHPMFKGDKASYSAIHHFVANNFGKPTICEDCGGEFTEPRSIHWANISGKYLRVRSDWRRLCRMCHVRFDRGRRNG